MNKKIPAINDDRDQTKNQKLSLTSMCFRPLSKGTVLNPLD